MKVREEVGLAFVILKLDKVLFTIVAHTIPWITFC